MPEKRRLSPLRAPSRRPPCRSLAVIRSKKHGGISVFHSKRIEHNPKNVLFQGYKQMNLLFFGALKLPMRDSCRVCGSACIPFCAPFFGFQTFLFSSYLYRLRRCALLFPKAFSSGEFFQIFVHFFGTAVYIENAKEKNGCEHPF